MDGKASWSSTSYPCWDSMMPLTEPMNRPSHCDRPEMARVFGQPPYSTKPQEVQPKGWTYCWECSAKSRINGNKHPSALLLLSLASTVYVSIVIIALTFQTKVKWSLQGHPQLCLPRFCAASCQSSQKTFNQILGMNVRLNAVECKQH